MWGRGATRKWDGGKGDYPVEGRGQGMCESALNGKPWGQNSRPWYGESIALSPWEKDRVAQSPRDVDGCGKEGAYG